MLEEENRNLKTAFVGMWFHKDLKFLFKDVFFPVAGELGFEAIRIDQEFFNERIESEIENKIEKSEFVIIDLTADLLKLEEIKDTPAIKGLKEKGNQGGLYIPRGSVCFEAGFSRGKGKAIIWTCRQDILDSGQIPFNMGHFSIIGWEEKNLNEFKENLKERIRGRLEGRDYKLFKSLWPEALSKKTKESIEISNRTRSILEIMSKKEARIFEKISLYVIKGKKTGIVFYDDCANKLNNISKSDDFYRLEEAGLIKNIQIGTYTLSPVFFDDHYIVSFGNLCNIHLYAFCDKEISIPVIALSNSGFEIYNIIKNNHDPDNKYLSCLSQYLKKYYNLQLKKFSLDTKELISIHSGIDVD